VALEEIPGETVTAEQLAEWMVAKLRRAHLFDVAGADADTASDVTKGLRCVFKGEFEELEDTWLKPDPGELPEGAGPWTFGAGRMGCMGPEFYDLQSKVNYSAALLGNVLMLPGFEHNEQWFMLLARHGHVPQGCQEHILSLVQTYSHRPAADFLARLAALLASVARHGHFAKMVRCSRRRA
jgi:hypothetical protein